MRNRDVLTTLCDFHTSLAESISSPGLSHLGGGDVRLSEDPSIGLFASDEAFAPV